MTKVLVWSIPALVFASAAARAAGNDALAIRDARIGLAQAIEAAEKHVGGKASKAEYEKHRGKPVFDVEVVKGNQVVDVKVDPADGRVVASTIDREDADDDDED